jgi:2'-5' RNA ligase
VTLFFLGSAPEDELPRLREALRALPAAPAPVRTAAPARLGRVLAVDLDDVAGTLGALHACGFPAGSPSAGRSART